MYNRPKFLWLSFIAFGIISYQCRIAILHGSEKRDYNLWVRYIGFELLWGIIILIIPSGIIVLLMHIFSVHNHVIELVINVLGLVYLYVGGVVLSSKLYDWKTKNIEKK